MIRELNINDAERIAEIEQAEQITPLPFKTLYHWFTTGYFGLGFEDEGVLQGYTIMVCTGSTGYSVITCISKSYQNKKVGRELCGTMIQKVKDMGVKLIMFEVRKSNVAELSMVKHFGAYVVDEKPGYYLDGEDAYVMNIDLKELGNETKGY